MARRMAVERNGADRPENVSRIGSFAGGSRTLQAARAPMKKGFMASGAD